ncbi:unnamed protein product [Rotaria sp. Silwood2]|nr:unnamed protein product [Rotaria sp. Silwood2]CAF4632114.1 unnamed protein product [Rotaria sp. Silwood2]
MQNEHMIIPLSISSNSNQLGTHLLRSKFDYQCLNEFLNSFCKQQRIINKNGILISSFGIKLDLNRLELALVPAIKDPYSNALIYSSTMVINFKESLQSIEWFVTDFKFFTCQIGNIDETIVSIIEPTECSLHIQKSREILNEQICILNILLLNIRLAYSDIKMICSLIHTVSKQISQSKTRKSLLTFISSLLTLPETLQPISIDHVGTFFRLATHQLYKPILVIIHIAMTEIPIRLIAIKSSIEIRNQLINSIDIQFISQSDDLHEFYLEPNQIRSLPIQLCSTIKQIHIRTANFALDYCDDPVQWSDIEKNHQSFLRSCSIDGKEAVYYLCLQSKPKYPVILQDPSLSIYQLTIIPSLTICNLLPCTLTFEIPSYPQKFEINAYKYHREHTLNR